MPGVPPFVVGWTLGAVLGGLAVAWLMRLAELRPRDVGVVIGGLTLAILVGSKLLYLAEAWPTWWLEPGGLRAALLSPFMRIPGGLLMAIAVGPLLARAVGMRFLAYADVVTPAAGLLIAGIRVGCHLEGCCFGVVTSLPWAVRFRAETDAYRWQMGAGLIHDGARESLPVHPLQLYFGVAGVALFLALCARRGRVRFSGEILVLFAVGYFWSTWLLEFLRARPHELTQITSLIAAVAATGLLVVARHLNARRTVETRASQL